MKEKEFLEWLIQDGLQGNTAMSRLKNCLMVCQYEGDLDVHYERDKCKELLSRLEYSKRDERLNLPPRHSIPINGNIFNGTATYKSAVRRYVDFRNNASRVSDVPYTDGCVDSAVTRYPKTFNSGSNTLKNKEFAIAAARIISIFPDIFTDYDIMQLTDESVCKIRFNCNSPILKEISGSMNKLNDITYINEFKRFYSDVMVVHSGRRYLVSNDWYHNSNFSNRNLFNDWLLAKLSG